MNPMTAIRIVIGAVIAVPLILLNLGVIGVSASVEHQLASLDPDAQAAPKSRGLARLGDMLIGTAIDHSITNHVVRTFDNSSYSNMREFNYEQDFTIEDFLHAGEALPPANQHLLMATARAPGIMMQSCDLLLETFAAGCAFGDVEVKYQRKEDSYRVRGALRFKMADDVGPWQEHTDWVPEAVTVSLPRERADLRYVPNADLADARRALMLAAQSECNSLRAEKGTCVISRVDLTETPARSQPTTELRASVGLSWLRQPSALNDKDRVAKASGESDGFFARFRKSESAEPSDAAAPAQPAATAKAEPESATVTITRGGNALQSGRVIKAGDNNHFRKVAPSE